jgi:hypothetical protein
MAIYRGVGGAGDISSGITLNEVTELTLRAEDAAVEAEASATAAEAAEAGVAADAAAALLSKTQAASSATDSAESATDSADSATAAAASFDEFDERYLGSKASAPTLDNDGNPLLTGALYWDTTTNKLLLYTGTEWIVPTSAVNGTTAREVYTATAGQTTFAVAYDVGFVDVYLNGVKLFVSTDFTATTGTSIVLTTGATVGDTIDIVAYGTFTVVNPQTMVDGGFANSVYTAPQTINGGTANG